MTRFAKARALALILPAALMAGALGSQYFGGLVPCEMCHWQRWPHDVAIVFALFAFGFRDKGMDRLMVALAALAIITSGVIGAFHAGVEYGWWEGPTHCSSLNSGMTLEDIMKSPTIRCDQAQWSLGGISLAGFNAIISIVGGGIILWLLGQKKEAA
jgi:disulfide bond formation protein DsbB